jgi:hypothetical protein
MTYFHLVMRVMDQLFTIIKDEPDAHQGAQAR